MVNSKSVVNFTIAIFLLSIIPAWSQTTPTELLPAQINILLQNTSISAASDVEKVYSEYDAHTRKLVQIGDYENALKLAEKANELFSGEMRSGILLGWVTGMSGDMEKAVILSKEALARPAILLPDPDKKYMLEGLINLSGFLIEMENYQSALETINKAFLIQTDNALIHYLAGLVHMKFEDYYLVSKHLKKGLALNPDLASANDYLMLSTAEDKLNHKSSARQFLIEGLKRYPMASGFHLNLGIQNQSEGSLHEAYYEFQTELLVSGEVGPYPEEARRRIVEISMQPRQELNNDRQLVSLLDYLDLQKEGKAKEYIHLLERAARMNNHQHVYINYLWGSVLNQSGKYEEARSYLENAVKRHPGFIPLELELSKAYAANGLKDQSEALIKNALLLAPEHWKVQELVGPSPSVPKE